MSNTPIPEPPAQELSSGSEQTLPSRPFQPISDPSASKRVCFYKSGDYKFSGHRMVINARTFKTFDALLDALSKKVPLPFGVRTITTPRGTHLVRALDDLHDGGSYVCSDQKRVKPLNLDEVNRRQVPWNTTRPFSAGRRKRQGQFGQFGRRNEFTNRSTKVTERVVVRTPKKLVVIKNRDPTVKRTIVLQRRTAPTFDALLDYLSQILQFPVLKLFSTDGRRVDGLATLILCSGVVVAAGNEPFRLGNYCFHRTGQMAQAVYMDTVEPSILQPRAQNVKSFSSGRGSRNFSLSSERYIVDQVNKSRNGSMNSQLQHHHGSSETEVNHHHPSCETGRIDSERHTCILPQDDDIEKSFRVNEDGSMTVEMKVHLTIKEEEMLHWTTTLSRSSLSKRTVCVSISESGNSSPDSNNAVAKDSSSISEDETKEENHPAGAGTAVGFNNERVYEGYTSTALGKKAQTGFKRTPTPGPRHVNKRASVESVKTVTESGVQETTMGHYSYMERTADGETTEGYCVVRHNNSSNRPIPKPRKTASAGPKKKGSHSSIRSAGVAEVLQIQNNGMEVTETVMHIYESQGCYDNYFANEEYSVDGVPLPDSTPASESKPSTVSGPHRSSNDCDIDFSTTDSLQRQKEEMLSLSSEPVTPTHEITNNLSSLTENEARSAINSQKPGTVKNDKTPKSDKKKKMVNPARNHKSSTSTSSSDKKQKESTLSPTKHSKHSSADKLSSNVSVGKKSLSSSESAKSSQKSRGAEKPQIKKMSQEEKMPRKEQALLANAENVRRTTPQRQNLNEAAAKDNGHNVNTPTGRPQMKKNMLDILQPKKSVLPGKKIITKPKSMTENTLSMPKKSTELSGGFSMPCLNPSPSEIHQYVENWLENVSPDPAPYTEEVNVDESESRTKVVFKIGGDSESDEKSECQTHPDENYPSLGDAVKKSASCLSVSHCHAGPSTSLPPNEQYPRGLCVSMPSVRVDPVHEENRMRAHKSAEAIGPADNESSSSTSNVLSPKAKIKPVLQQLCSSIQCIRGASETNTTSNLEKSNSLPDFSTQVASVFGSSCKAFLSFLSVMTLRDNLTGNDNQSRGTSEAMLMMGSLQKISAIGDQEEQRASLTDLQSRASSEFRERWKDFQILRERLESEPLSPKVSETEFALDVVSEGGDVFEDQHLVIDELMEELNMPEDLRVQISSTIQQAKSFYPIEESTFVETEKNQSDSEEDVEKFVEESIIETKQSLEPDTTCMAEDITQTKQDDDRNEQAKMMTESDQELDNVQETNIVVKESEISQTERDEDKENEEEKQVEEVEEGREEMNGTEDGDTKEKDDDDADETEMGESEREEETMTEEKMDDNGQEEWKVEKRSEEEEKIAEKVEKEMTVDEGEEGEELDLGEKEVVEETEEGFMDDGTQEAREDDSVEETDEREGVDETEEDEKGEEDIDEEADDEGETEVKKGEEVDEEVDDDNEETDEGEEVDNIIEDVQEEKEEEEEAADGLTVDAEDEAEEGVEENDKEEMTEVIEEKGEVENVIEDKEEEETDALSEKNEEDMVTEKEEEEEEEEEEMIEVTKERDEEEKVENVIEEREDEEEEEVETDVVTEKDVEDKVIEQEEEEEEETEMEGAIEKKAEVGNINEEMVKEEETDAITERDVEDKTTEDEEEEMEEVIEVVDEEDVEGKDEEKDKTEVVSEDNEGEEEEEQEEEQEEEEEEVDDVEVKNIEEDEEEEETDKDVEDQECDEGEESRKNSPKEESVEGKEVVEAMVIEEQMKAEQTLDEEEREYEEKLDEGSDQEGEQEAKDEVEEESISDYADSTAGDRDCWCKILLEEASCLQQQSSCEDANIDTKASEHNADSPTKYSSEGKCEDEKGNATDTVNELETDEGGGDHEETCSGLPHPVEISQELLDFVNSALQSSSLIFTYDAKGNIRIEPDNARVVQTKQTVIPKSREESSYGLKRLPSPCTSDLSDYRPETSESGGYKSQDSVDIVTESGEETSIHNRKANVEQDNSELSVASHSEALQSSRLKSGGSFSSFDSSTKASKEDLSYFSAASSQKADTEAAAEAAQCISFASEKDSTDGVLIDQGRWLLKENHLIRKSPPVSLGMYGDADSTSIDTGQENTSEESPPHYKTQHNPLAAISSSELEEMAKPQSPKYTYYNMPHGSDSDPFMDDSSFKSGKKDTSSVKGRGVKVSPTIDTSKTWASKNGSLSSFASVEFKVQDRKVHPEGEPSAVTETRRTSSGGRSVLRTQDSLDTLHVRCGQYCPIL